MNLKEIWRDKVVERFEDLQERARQQWMTLAPRERLIVSVMASLLVVLLSVLVVKEVFTFFSRHDRAVQASLENIGSIQSLSAEISAQRTQLIQFDRLRNMRGAEFQLNSFLENQARQFALSVEQINPTKVRTPNPSAEEDWVEVKLAKDVRLDGVLKWLRAIEEPLGIRIIDLQIKPQFADPTKLEVSAVVAATKEAP